MIRTLHALGITNVCMMTGDNRKTAKSVAMGLGIDNFQAEVLPEDKANYRYIVGFNSALIALGLTGILSPSSF